MHRSAFVHAFEQLARCTFKLRHPLCPIVGLAHSKKWFFIVEAFRHPISADRNRALSLRVENCDRLRIEADNLEPTHFRLNIGEYVMAVARTVFGKELDQGRDFGALQTFASISQSLAPLL